jgi:murein L,D-transpeptidase YcbB/YkuD
VTILGFSAQKRRGDAQEEFMRSTGKSSWLAGICLAAVAVAVPAAAATDEYLFAGPRVAPGDQFRPQSALTSDIMPKQRQRPFAVVIVPAAIEPTPHLDRAGDVTATAAPAHLEGPTVRSTDIDTGATGTISPILTAAPLPSRRAESANTRAIALEPELPPEVSEPPSFEPIQTRVSRPLASLADAPPKAPSQVRDEADAPSDARGPDILAALSAMDGRPISARPLGGGDWRAARDAVRAFYAGRSYSPAWTSAGEMTAPARAALSQLSRAADDGLDLSALALPTIPKAAATPTQLAQADVAITQAIVAYAVEASGGRVDPARVAAEIDERPTIANPVRSVEQVLAATDPARTLADFNPPQKGYRELRDKLAQIRASNPAMSENPLTSGPALKIGMIDPRVALIRTRFGLDQDPSLDSDNALVYDGRVASAVASFQRANGLKGTGVLTPGTALALAGGDGGRQEAIILANMEMWRWEPRQMGDERVEVNVPDFTLNVMRGEETLHSARVIVGKPDTQTPIFSNEIRYILLNPSWRVPQSIIKKEMLPKLAKDPDYFARMGFEVIQRGDSLMVRQPPGERNALGRILFMFPNDHSVYLHDTPSRGLFGATRRALSHGCIRLDQPLQLGELLMGGPESGWSQEKLRSLVGGGERTIFLPRRIPIHIEYFTAFVDESGDLQLREDLYGHMRRLQDALGLRSQG